MEVIFLGERLPKLQIDKFGTVAKNVYIFEYSGLYKSIVHFSGFFIVIVSILSILVVFRPQSPVKLHNECFLNENPRNYYNIDWKPVFISLYPVQKACA